MIAAMPIRIDNFDKSEKCYCNLTYVQWLNKNNISIILVSDYNQIDTIVSICDLLILPGGYDVDPHFTGLNKDENYPYYKQVDILDFILLSIFHHAHKPVLGICRGMQMMNLYFKGSLFYDIKNHQGTTHSLVFTKNSILKPFYTKNDRVNSFHHQAINELSPFLTVEAMSEDGIIEAIRYEDYMIGVQWHPELMANDPILLYFLQVLQNTSQKNILK
ncbi:MAG: gamma-glutamyl-gamma-aminobutyrate hydrolase family protein [Erysipelotrichia bacterium]|nr:gamma-glutamyl-gamma-aminobutyrate hydrolase family protein [Erysipelotrichia bacterium]NCC54415.1 gamma-glutamyl-gamma-aminobutyrate hydrolase family protein [Erysipelotrichia bacterium]